MVSGFGFRIQAFGFKVWYMVVAWVRVLGLGFGV